MSRCGSARMVELCQTFAIETQMCFSIQCAIILKEKHGSKKYEHHLHINYFTVYSFFHHHSIY